jgi:type II restriction/modification system DNA methylase subunit YeeA
MDTKPLERFAQAARRQLKDHVSAKLARVLTVDSAALRGQAAAIQKLKDQISDTSKEVVVERVAYTWFNRFCALRFMDVNGYTAIGAVSPAAGFTQPELLQEAKAGHIDADLPVDRQTVFDLLGGRLRATDPQQEAYRLLLVATCNSYHRLMPFLFEPIADYTELLMPDDLLSEGSILQAVRNALTPERCQDVEVIGWLYQFYIAEKKDQVFAALKQGQKIRAEDIPAATQLFTPHWIVRFLVENSLGRLWLLNRPGSRLAEGMPYYIRPEQTETGYLRVGSPEELTVCDPAVGSGHMLVYAFDLLYAIYEEEGYNAPDIPRLILEKNLYGIEIDERAAALAAFALVMKARARDRRFFRRLSNGEGLPNICVLRKFEFTDGELEHDAWLTGSGMLRKTLLHDLHLFALADNVGSLPRPQLTVGEITTLRERLAHTRPLAVDLFAGDRHEKVLAALDQAVYLARKYHVVVANPPYMGGKGMNDELKDFLQADYTDVKSDLFSAFIIRNLELAVPKGQLGFMTPFVWMFISSYEKLREFLINKKTITSLVQLEYSGFDGATVPICTFTLENAHHPNYRGGYVRLSDFRGAENQGPKTLEAVRNPNCIWFYRAAAADFKKIPGAPIAYWVSEKLVEAFESKKRLGEYIDLKSGMSTTNNEMFLRLWQEINQVDFLSDCKSMAAAENSGKKWFPYVKGGSFRRWYGNLDYVVNWKNNGADIKRFVVNNPRDPDTTHWSRRIFNTEYFFRPLLAWSRISSASFSVRFYNSGTIFSDASNGGFGEEDTLLKAVCFLNTKIVSSILAVLSPTMNFYSGDIVKIPFEDPLESLQYLPVLLSLSTSDWNSYETSWDFTDLPLLRAEFRQPTLAATYITLRSHWQSTTLEMQRLEEENNRLFIDAYGLQDELTPDVPLDEITLTCNPHYRYGGNRSEAELEVLLCADTMREFISYAVGCMFGRYSLDKPGLVLANGGETLDDYLRQVPTPTFPPDRDNVIPLLDGDWFPDDIVERFKRFLRLTFGETHYADNLAFIEKALGRDLRGYFLRDFYTDHVRRYQKRPIYWLFSSPKGSFNALIYLHRYRPDTVSVVLNDYLREFRSKLAARKDHLQALSISAAAAARDKTRALKEIDAIDKILTELRDYENDVLYPLATRQLQIDLDDGVKVNYAKFGAALKKIPGLAD